MSDSRVHRCRKTGGRHVEIDCWDGRSKPRVTHGHTLCTVEQFDNVAKAVGECAFTVSDLPVILSLEQHCSPQQQHVLTKMMVAHLGDALLPYDMLVATGRAMSLGPIDLNCRVLVKGKVKLIAPERPSASCRSRIGSQLFNKRDYSGFHGRSTSDVDESHTSSRRFGSTVSGADVSVDFATNEHSSERVSQRRSTSSIESMAKARQSLYNKAGRRSSGAAESNSDSKSRSTDQLYASYLCLRSLPVSSFMQSEARQTSLNITSINEDKLLAAMGLSSADRKAIEGLQPRHVLTAEHLDAGGNTEEEMSTLAIIRLAREPPLQVGQMQRRTSQWLLRPFPLGLRFSGNNMSPLLCWLSGAQHVALNMSNNDLAIQLHYALFNGSAGFVLKPLEMQAVAHDDTGSGSCEREFWPPPCRRLHRVTIEAISILNLPKRGERRPRYCGSRGACHGFHPELSGKHAPPDNLEPSSTAVHIALHPIGGFCAISKTLPIRLDAGAKFTTRAAEPNGLNVDLGVVVHLVAAHPHATFLRIGVNDGIHEAAYDSAVLGRLRRGYRVFQMRSHLGTRIELCYLFVRISFGSEPNLWVPARQMSFHHEDVAALRQANSEAQERISEAQKRIYELTRLLAGAIGEGARNHETRSPRTPRTPQTEGELRTTVKP